MTYDKKSAAELLDEDVVSRPGGQVTRAGEVLHEGNAISGEIVNGVATKRSWEEKTSPGGWEGAPAPERKRPASKEKVVLIPRRKR